MERYNHWIEVDLSAIAANYQKVSVMVEETPIMAVVKANAYGHGAVPVAMVLAEAGVAAFAVTTLEEGQELREGGIDLPILVFCPLQEWQAPAMAALRLTPTIDNGGAMAAFAAAAGRDTLPFAIKVDTGMGRYGVDLTELELLARQGCTYENIYLDQVYSHFADAADKELARKQLALLEKGAATLEAAGMSGFRKHIAGSSGAYYLPEARLDMVRIGSLLYGQGAAASSLHLETTWRNIARITATREIPAGSKIGYGLEYTARRAMTIGVIPVGYHDGFGVDTNARKENFNNAWRQFVRQVGKIAAKRPRCVKKGERSLPVVGRIAMQTTVIDLTGSGLSLGDTVEIPMRRTTANPRTPYLYREEGQLVLAADIHGRLHDWITEA